MKKLIIFIISIGVLSGIHLATAAPTSTRVQNLFISDRASTGFILSINSSGLVVTSTDATGAGGSTTTISAQGVTIDGPNFTFASSGIIAITGSGTTLTFTVSSSSLNLDTFLVSSTFWGFTPNGDLGGTWDLPSVDDDSHAHTAGTISGLSTTDFTSANLSLWTNNLFWVQSSSLSAYLTTSTNLSVGNFNSANISQWTDNIGLVNGTGTPSALSIFSQARTVTSSASLTFNTSTLALTTVGLAFTNATGTGNLNVVTLTVSTSTMPTNGLFAVATSSPIFTILNNGRVGIGTASPVATFNLVSTAVDMFRMTNTDVNSNGWSFRQATGNNFVITDNQNSADRLTIDNTGNITIGGSFNSSGTITQSGVVLSTSTGANPTASLGLSAINGTANTFMRSDAAPALSVSITPVWTGLHQFSGAGISSTQLWSASTSVDFASALALTSAGKKLTAYTGSACGGTDQVTSISAIGVVTCSAQGSGGGGGGGVGTSTLGVYDEGNLSFFVNSSTISASSGLRFTSSTGLFQLSGIVSSTNLFSTNATTTNFAATTIMIAPVNQTLTAQGQISVKTTSSTLNFHDGTAERVLNPEQCDIDFVIESPAAGEDDYMRTFNSTSTITQVYSHHRDTNSSTTFNLIWGNGTIASSSARHLFTNNVSSTASSTDIADSYPSLVAFASTTVDRGMTLRLIASVASSSQWGLTICYKQTP